ncbi:MULTISPECIES: hypothetical protein [Colwellia]|uniref:PEP-CTERM protein-sorting domain-containing protein n=1 Tax=Colwellia marinimaniae TaxID=1513592 RepID=A0ABQ0MZQ6_9GAMM|nr:MULTISPECIES: hypothetical protein [Colwellia]GAW97846.1 hypothetical protein MTCD1_03494 [Colwellia marinimaniae]
MKYIIQFICLVIAIATSSSAMATAMCSFDDVKLDFVQLAYDPDGDAPDALFDVGAGNGISATDCILLLGNDQPLPKDHNIGEYQDGLLNGEVWHSNNNGNSPADPLLTPYNTLFDPFYDSETPETPLAENGDEGYNNILFINPETDLQDLDDTDGNTNKTDPGWVFLGKDDGDIKDSEGNKDGQGDGFQYSDTGVDIVNNLIEDMNDPNYNNLTGIAIENLLNIKFTCFDDLSDPLSVFNLGDSDSEGEKDCTIGTWSIMPDFDIVDKLEELFGDGVFDHLALVFKTGNVCHPSQVDGDDVEGKGKGKGNDKDNSNDCIDALEGPQFAIYDFNFTDIFNSFPGGNAEEALQSPYNIGGTFNLFNTFHGHGISHISVWVRDPAGFTTTEMPEPKSTMLMLLAVALLVLRVKSKHTLL